MAEAKATWLERLSEWGYRVDTVQDLWPIVRPIVWPAVVAVIAGGLKLAENAPWSIVFLFAVWGFAGVYVVIAARQVTTRVRQLPIPAQTGADSLPRPTVDMLEEGRKAQLAKREALIAEWRDMLREVRQQHLATHEPIVKLLESHKSFLTFRPYWSDQTMKAIYTPDLLPSTTVAWTTATLASSTIPFSLHSMLNDIDHWRKQWFVD